MGKFNFTETQIRGLYIVEPCIFEDNRGHFMETYNYKDFSKAGLDMIFVQDNQSMSRKGVLRGLHFQKNHPQGKLIRVIYGEVFDVVVDLRKGSETFGKWYSIILSSENMKQLYIPEGFAHGFLAISEKVELFYKCTDYYYPEDEGGIIWNDPDLAINWPEDVIIDNELISNKDKKLITFKDYIGIQP